VLLTLTSTAATASGCASVSAADIGYLLHKHPDRVQQFDVSVGTAHVFYPEVSDARCTAALLLEVDPIALVRGRKGPASEGFALGQYVNDRPYAASSMLAVAMARVFKTAMAGRCDARPELPATPLPLEIAVPALPCRGGAALAAAIFEPLGWQVDARPIPLDTTISSWGDSRYLSLTLSGTLTVAEALNHLYVLLPVLDDAKHYWVSPDEVDKLIRSGEGWLATHPSRELITRRYLAHRSSLTRTALARLAEVDDLDSERFDDAAAATEVGDEPDGPVPLAEQRRGAVLAVLRSAGASSVADLGCGEGTLVAALLADRSFARIVAADVSARSLELAARRLKLDRMPENQRQRLDIFQSSLTYRDARLAGLDAAVLMEVIEHVDPPRLAALERCVFAESAPRTVVVTTPNVEYNVRFEGLEPGRFRHRDHRFEWTREQFRSWAERVASSFGYDVRFLPVGPDDVELGPPTQLAVFTRREAAAA
jgi:3' terminal RNA ribose 2'-O-methyltransferase Hen1